MRALIFVTCVLTACGSRVSDLDGGGGGTAGSGAGGGEAGGDAAGGGDVGGGDGGGDGTGGGSGGGVDAGPITCSSCLVDTDCRQGAACVQYAGDDHCGKFCQSAADCAPGEICVVATSSDNTRSLVCVPGNGTCGTSGCGTCDPGMTCDPLAGECVSPDSDGGIIDDGDAGDFDVDAGLTLPDGGRSDAGIIIGIGADGGQVHRFIFAVLGDTRPPATNDTAHYPVARVTNIYNQIEALNPRPQFVVATGDYMFAQSTGTEGPPQMNLYLTAKAHYSGLLFGSMGNHECTGPPGANCAPPGPNNHNYQAWFNGVVKPLGKTVPYYEIPFHDTVAGGWTAKLLIVACNAWSPAQKTWFTNALARRTDYTFIARHEPRGGSGPCNPDMDAILANPSTRYTMLLVGHVHNYSHSGKQLLEGVGGAPLTGSANFGFATIQQRVDGGVTVRQYDSTTSQVVSTYTLPPN